MSPRTFLIPLMLPLASVAGCIRSEDHSNPLVEGIVAAENAAVTAGAPALAAAQPLTNQSLDPEARSLLQLAFAASSKMPLNPHLKNRARGQEQAVQAAIQLGQHAIAFEFAEQIPNWRRGTSYADLALSLLELDPEVDAEWLLQRADQVAAEPAAEVVDQDWRRDRIRSKIAAVYVHQQEMDRAQSFARGVSPSETAYFEAARAKQLSAEEFDQQLEAVPALMGAANFEQARSTLANLALLHDAFYADPVRRARVHASIEQNWLSVPMLIRIQIVVSMAESAVRHQDQVGAMLLLDQAKALINGFEWTPDLYIQLYAQVAKVRGQAGVGEQACGELNAAMSLYESERSRIVDIDRAGVLRRVAEAYFAAGDVDAAETSYARAVEESFVNPNGRPRALDLTANCVSMALSGFMPSEDLRTRMQAQFKSLGEPW